MADDERLRATCSNLVVHYTHAAFRVKAAPPLRFKHVNSGMAHVSKLKLLV